MVSAGFAALRSVEFPTASAVHAALARSSGLHDGHQFDYNARRCLVHGNLLKVAFQTPSTTQRCWSASCNLARLEIRLEATGEFIVVRLDGDTEAAFGSVR
jgi:hypothetical protein